MRYKITVTGTKAKDLFKLGEDYKKGTKIGRERVASKLENILIENINAYNLVWRGRLVNTLGIKAIDEDTLGVEMAFFAWAIEKGHKIPSGVNISLLTTWARDKMGIGRGNAWIAKVKREGHMVLAKPFISDSMTTIRPQVKKIMENSLPKK